MATGNKITMNNGNLEVPDNPLIPFIEGDGIGSDIWLSLIHISEPTRPY